MKYSPLDKINFFITSYGRLFLSIFRSTVWFPFLILALFQAAGLFAFSKFYAVGFNRVLYPILSLFYPPEIFHYPRYYLALPYIYSAFNSFILGPTVWLLMSAVAVYRLAGYKDGVRFPFGQGLSKAFKSYFPLLLFWVINTAVVWGILWISNMAFRDYAAGSPRVNFLLAYAFRLFAYIISAFLLYTIPGIIISSKKLGGALKGSINLCKTNFFLTYFIIAVPGSVGAVIDLFVSGFSPQIIGLFNPGLIATFLYIRIGLGIFLNLFTYGAAVFVYCKMGKDI